MNVVTSPDPLLSRMAALGDPIRLRMLALLERAELGVGELGEVLQLPQSSVSRHLKQLAEAGWVVSRSERTANLYRMPAGELDAAASQLWLLSRAEIADWPVLEHDALRLEQRLTQRRSVFADVADEWDDLRTELYGTLFTDVAIRALLPRDGLFCKDGRGWNTSSVGRSHGHPWPPPSTLRGKKGVRLYR